MPGPFLFTPTGMSDRILKNKRLPEKRKRDKKILA